MSNVLTSSPETDAFLGVESPRNGSLHFSLVYTGYIVDLENVLSWIWDPVKWDGIIWGSYKTSLKKRFYKFHGLDVWRSNPYLATPQIKICGRKRLTKTGRKKEIEKTPWRSNMEVEICAWKGNSAWVVVKEESLMTDKYLESPYHVDCHCGQGRT